jgi:hypothetical protein
MPASRLRQPPHRRTTSAGPTGSDDQPSRKSQIPSWLPYAAAALIGVWLLQAVVARFFLGRRRSPTASSK